MTATESNKHHQKAVWIHFRKPPFGSQSFKEGLDLSLVYGTFEHPVKLLFSQEAVWALIKDQRAQPGGPKIHTDGLKALALYDIDQIYVDKQSLADRGLTQQDLTVQAAPTSANEIRLMIETAKLVFTY